MRVKSHESRTKDCLVNNVKIKGSNYNLSGGLIAKLQKIQWPNWKYSFWILKHCSFLDNCSLPSSLTTVLVVKGSEDVRGGTASMRGARLTADIPRHRDARRPLLSSCNNPKKCMHPLTIKARGETDSGEGGKIREGIKGEQGKRKKS